MAYFRAMLVVAVMVFLNACKSGDAGPVGPPGTNGKTGSANVIYSSWITVPAWTLESFFGIQQRYYTLRDSTLRQSYADSGVVLVYIKFSGLPQSAVQLPVQMRDQDRQYWFYARGDSIRIMYTRISANTDPASIGTTQAVRYILIPGGVHSLGKVSEVGGRLETASPVSNYDEVCERYSIPR